MITIWMMSARLAILGLLKTKIFWNNGYDVLISVYDVTKNFFSHGSKYIADLVMWPKFGNSSTSMGECIINPNLWRFDQKKNFFWRVVLVQIQWFETVTKYGLEILYQCFKGLKLKVRKFLGLIRTFVEVTGKKWQGEGPFCAITPPPLHLFPTSLMMNVI